MAAHALGLGRHQEEHALGSEDALPHAEALLVVAAHHLEDVTLVLVTEGLAGDLGRDALVIEDTPVIKERRGTQTSGDGSWF